MSLTVDGFWKAGFWDTGFWADGFWLEVVAAVPGVPSVYSTPVDFWPDVSVYTGVKRKRLMQRALLLG